MNKIQLNKNQQIEYARQHSEVEYLNSQKIKLLEEIGCMATSYTQGFNGMVVIDDDIKNSIISCMLLDSSTAKYFNLPIVKNNKIAGQKRSSIEFVTAKSEYYDSLLKNVSELCSYYSKKYCEDKNDGSKNIMRISTNIKLKTTSIIAKLNDMRRLAMNIQQKKEMIKKIKTKMYEIRFEFKKSIGGV